MTTFKSRNQRSETQAIEKMIWSIGHSLPDDIMARLLGYLKLIGDRKTPREKRLPFDALALTFKLVIKRYLRTIDLRSASDQRNQRDANALPTVSQIKFLFRLLRQFPAREDAQLTIAATSEPELFPALQQVHAVVKHRRRLRQRQSLEAPTLRTTVAQFLHYVTYPWQAPYVDFSGGSTNDSVTACTDGKRIFLPQTIALDGGVTGLQTNIRALVFLALHELQHWGILGDRSSFEFSFDTAIGSDLLDQLRHRRKTFARNREQWDGPPVMRKVLREAGLHEDYLPPRLSHLQAFTFFSQSPKRLSLFFNLFEDMRLAHQLVETQYAELQTESALALDQIAPHDLYARGSDRLLQALASVAFTQRTGVVPEFWPSVGVPHQEHFAAGEALLQKFKEISFENKSPELSAQFAWELDLMFEEWQSRDQSMQRSIDRQADSLPSLTEIMARRHLEGLGGERHDGEGGATLNRRKERLAQGDALPEFSYDDGALQFDAVRIRQRTWKPHRKAYPGHEMPAVVLPKQLFTSQQSRRSSAQQQLSANPSDSFAMDHVPEFIAAMTAGQRTSSRIYNERGRASRRRISIAIDLSVSMETRSPKLSVLPIQMAIATAQEIEKVGARNKIAVDIYGLHDGGRQPVSLYSVEPGHVGRLHSLGIGGARFGAAIRWLASTPESRGDDHLILLFTDGCPSYFKQGNDSLVRKVNKNNCKACQLRAIGRRGCSVEKHERFGSARGEMNIFESAAYQYADIANAIDGVPARTQVRYVQFVAAPNDQLLDRFLPGKWLASNGHFDLAASLVGQ